MNKHLTNDQIRQMVPVLGTFGVDLESWVDVPDVGTVLHLVDRRRELVKVGWHPTLGFVVHVPGSLPSGYGLVAAARAQAELAEATRCLVALLKEGLPVGIGGVIEKD